MKPLNFTHSFEHNLQLLYRKDFRNIFIFLLVYFSLILAPTGWNGNEEQYYLLFHKTVAPELFQENHSSFDSSRGRVVPAIFFGSLIKYFGYELSQILVGMLIILCYSYSIAKVFYFFGLRVIDCLLVISLFLIFGQQLFGGEWLFGRSGESKVFAYILVLIALPYNFKRKHYTCLTLLALATYFHFLVGLFWTIFFYTNTFYLEKSFKKLAYHSLYYSLLMTPLLAVILPEILEKSNVSSSFSSDYIYSRIRHPHHVDPFLSLSWFVQYWAKGIFILILAIPFYISTHKNNANDPLSSLLAITSFYLLLFLIISYLDRETLYFGKFYFYRPTSLLLLLALILIAKTFPGHNPKHSILASSYFHLAIIAYAVVPTATHNILLAFENRYATPKLLHSINKHTKETDIILVDTSRNSNDKANGLIRDIKRPTLVEWKFVPTEKNDIQRWYKLILLKERVFRDGCNSRNTSFNDFIIFNEERMKTFIGCSTIIYKDNNLIYFKAKYEN